MLCRRLALLVVALSLPLPLAHGQDKTLASYFPLETNKEWRYKKKVLEDDKLLPAEAGIVVVRVTGVEEFALPEEKGKKEKEKGQAFTLESTTGDKKAAENKKLVEEITVLADGVYRRAAAGKTITPPLAFLKLQKSWQIDSMTKDTPIKGTFTLGQENVTVPAGTFPMALTSTADKLQIGEQTMYVKYWFAAGVGMVKQQMRVGGYEVTLELQGK